MFVGMGMGICVRSEENAIFCIWKKIHLKKYKSAKTTNKPEAEISFYAKF